MGILQLELLVFDCAHGFGIGQHGQYRWYQVSIIESFRARIILYVLQSSDIFISTGALPTRSICFALFRRAYPAAAIFYITASYFTSKRFISKF